jgi:hypothetical protein
MRLGPKGVVRFLRPEGISLNNIPRTSSFEPGQTFWPGSFLYDSDNILDSRDIATDKIKKNAR